MSGRGRMCGWVQDVGGCSLRPQQLFVNVIVFNPDVGHVYFFSICQGYVRLGKESVRIVSVRWVCWVSLIFKRH